MQHNTDAEQSHARDTESDKVKTLEGAVKGNHQLSPGY